MLLGSPSSARETGWRVFLQLVLSDRSSKLMFWHSLPFPVIGGQLNRELHFCAEEWMDQKLFHDTKSEMVQPHDVELDDKEKCTRAEKLKQTWSSYVKDEFDLTHLVQTRA